MAALDRLVLHGIDDLQAGHDLAGGEDADLELVVGEGRDALGEELARAIDRVERLGEARGQTPLHFGHRLSDGRRCERAGDGYGTTTHTGGPQELATLH